MGAWEALASQSEPEGGWALGWYLSGASPLRTGTVLDHALGGGIMPGVTVLGGASNVGKSSLACHVAANVCDSGRRVAYVTLDDTWGNVVAHCMSAWSVAHGRGRFSWSEVPKLRSDAIRRHGADHMDWYAESGSDPALDAWAGWSQGAGRMLAVNDRIATVGGIEAAMAACAAEGTLPQLLVVDYLQQYSTGDPKVDESEYSRVSEVAKRLQRLALWGPEGWDGPWPGLRVLALSALNRGRSDREPTMDWLRGSSAIGYAAWAAVILDADGTCQANGFEVPRLKVATVKNKAGAKPTLSARMFGAYSYVEEVTGDG